MPRLAVLVEVVVTAALFVVQVGFPRGGDAAVARRVMELVAMPGSGMPAMTGDQASWLSGRLEQLMRARTRGRAGRDDFLNAVSQLKQSGAAESRPLCRGGRTLCDVADELGALMRQERLGSSDANRRVRDRLVRMGQVRAAGAPEAEVQRLAREAVARGELAPDQGESRREVRQRMEVLVEDLVESVGAAGSHWL